jgi:drug/metabolite transporter (DMT)-like permease
VPSTISARTRGYAAIVITAFLLGAYPTLSKLVLEELHPLLLGFLMQLISGAALAPSVRRVRIPRSAWKLIVLSGVIGSVLGPVIYFYGLGLTTASNAVLLSNGESLFTILLAYAVLGERATRREYVALAGIAAGAFLVTTQLRFGDVRFAEFLIGNLMLLAAAACWGVNNTISTILVRRVPILPLVACQLLVGSAVFAVIVVLAGIPFAVSTRVLLLLLLLSLSGVGLFNVLFFYAFRTIGAMRTGAILPSSVLWGILIALSILPGETLSDVQVFGGALMVVALVAVYVFRGPSETTPLDETLKPAASDGPDSP